MKSITINAYAKINLFLEVCDKRPDSYHNIDSVMQTVSLHDVITLSKADAITLSNNKGLPNNENNLAYKAAKLFLDSNSISSGVSIIIEKNIPVSAGLAGGSTDAAAVLKGLNELYETTMTVDELCALGSQIGADVPFCIKGGTFITKGIGDEFFTCPAMPQCYLVITKAGEGVSTPQAYGEIDKSRENTNYVCKSSKDLVAVMAENNLTKLVEELYNAFELVVIPKRPMVTAQKNIIMKNSAVGCLMSGSGPSVFGIFEKENDAVSAVNELKTYGAEAFVCTPI